MGKTPVDKARGEGHMELVELLQELCSGEEG